jgi:hypothetical protein
MLPFTPRLRIAIAYAEGRQPQAVSSLDLLAGIMSLGGGVAVGVLRARGLADSPPLATPSEDRIPDDTPVQYRSCALTALSRATAEAVSRSNQLVGIEHMLVGILMSPSPEVSSLFAEKGVSVEEILADLRKNM